MIGVIIFIVLMASLLLAGLCGFEDLDWQELEGDDNEKEQTNSGFDPRNRRTDLDL